MKTAVCGECTPHTVIENLGKYTDKVVILPSFSALPVPVSAHADMLIFPAPKSGKIYTHAEYLASETDIFSTIADTAKMSIVQIPEKVGCDYPSDVLLNALALG